MCTVSSGGRVKGEFLQSTDVRGSGGPIQSECQLKKLQHVERTGKTTKVGEVCRCNCLTLVNRIKLHEVSSNLIKITLLIGPWFMQSVHLLDSRVTAFTTFRTSTAAKYVISLFLVYQFVFVCFCCLLFLFTVCSYYNKLSCPSSWALQPVYIQGPETWKFMVTGVIYQFQVQDITWSLRNPVATNSISQYSFVFLTSLTEMVPAPVF